MFDRFQKLEVTNKTTAEMELWQLRQGDVTPVLEVRHAGQKNRAYRDAVQRDAKKTVKQLKTQGASLQMVEDLRNRDREVYPKCVIVGWSGILNDSGEEVPFSVQACMELLSKLPDDIFDEIRAFAQDIQNFRDPDALSPEDTEELGEG